ncbi:MAG TPA: hypothetical protein VFU35_09035 [Jatrophihabitans sp.]|nr:hypothetical protein [Jatrophihabitans sp.]
MRRGMAVCLVLGLVLAGCSSSGRGTTRSTTAASTTRSSATATRTATATTSAAAPHSPAAAPPQLTHFRVADLTWIGTAGWALGSADCLTGHGTCDAIEHTTDGGKTWQSMPAPRANISLPGSVGGCASPCISGLRFATSKIGYAFNGFTVSAPALFMTTNGGQSWQRGPGGALALESANGNVIRVVSSGSGCPGPCHVGIETSAVGSTAWTPRSLGQTPATYGLDFDRTGARAYLLFEGHVAGGAQNARSILYRSGDNGVAWHSGGEPCPQAGSQEVDSVALSSAPDGGLAILCRYRGASGGQFVITSTNGGASYRAGSRTALGAAPVGAFGAASAQVLVVTSDQAYRSTDGGNHFERLGANAGSSPGQLGWLGFESPTVGHGIAADRRSVWTTADAGVTWSRHTFG